jgi:hypothetical protein
VNSATGANPRNKLWSKHTLFGKLERFRTIKVRFFKIEMV